jgi:hypothetical protein
MTYPPLDIGEIRARLARTGPFALPRWVAIDLAHLLAEVDRLRVAPEPDRGLVTALQAARAEAALLRERAEAREAVWLAERKKFTKRAAEHAAEHAADKAQIVGWLRAHAANTPPGPISPVRRVEQTYATKVAGIIERGEHRRPSE